MTPTRSTTPMSQRLEGFFSLPSSGQPAWISDNELVFLSDMSGVPQVHKAALGSNGVTQLTNFPERVQSLIASSINRRVIFGMDHGGNERQQLWLLDPDTHETSQLTTAGDAIHEPGQLSPDGGTLVYRSNERELASFDILVLNLDEERPQPVRVFSGDGQLVPLDVTNGGRLVLIKRLLTNLDADLLLLNNDSGQVRVLNPRSDEAAIGDARFGADASTVWQVTNASGDFQRLERIDLASDLREVVIADDWDVELFAVALSETMLAFAINRDGASVLAIRHLDGGEMTEVEGAETGVMDRLAWSPTDDHLATGWSTSKTPSVVAVSNYGGKRVASLGAVSHNQHTAHELQSPEVVRFTSFDGRSIPALWFTPTSAPPWNVVVDVHGGPESQRRPAFNALVQFLLSEGYAVLAPNVRGSTGYGKAYCHLDDHGLRMDAVADLNAAHDWLEERHDVQRGGIVIMGQSYGGFMTLAALTEYPENWAAGVDVVGIANFVTFLQRTGPWRRAHRAAEYGDLDRDRAVLKRISPISKVDRISAPLLVIHGRNDPRVPLYEAEQIVEALRAREQEVELLVFDDEGHGLAKRSNRIQGYGAVARFLNRVLNTRV